MMTDFALAVRNYFALPCTIETRGHSQMTSAVRGREGGGRFLTIGGGGCVISILRILTRGEGVQNLENLADVIYEWPLISQQFIGEVGWVGRVTDTIFIL